MEDKMKNNKTKIRLDKVSDETFNRVYNRMKKLMNECIEKRIERIKSENL
jgi:hypothetical protein